MHRSGTSALTRVLNLLGADLPRNVEPANAHNLKGYWEPRALMTLHDEILQAAETSWHDTGPVPEFWNNPQFIDQRRKGIVHALQNDYADSSLLGIKDPRISRVVPLTVAAFREFRAEPRFVPTLRNP